MSRNENSDTSMGDAFRQRRTARQQTAPPPKQQPAANNVVVVVPNGGPPSLVEIQAEQQQQQQDRRRPQQQNNQYDHRSSSSFQQNRRGGDRGGDRGGRRGREDRSHLPVEQGVVCSMKESFGFIYCADREEELFFHFSEVQNCHPADLVMDDELEFRVGMAKNNDKMAAFQLHRLDRGTIVFETEEQPGVRLQGVVEKPFRTDRSGNVSQEGVIRLLEKQEEVSSSPLATAEGEPIVAAATGEMVRFTPHDYVPDPADQQDQQSEGGGRFQRNNSTVSNSSSRGSFGSNRNNNNNNGQQQQQLGANDLVEFTLVTSRRNQTKYARKITLLQSDRDRQRALKEEKLLANATLERGTVTTLKTDFGFLRSNKRREEVYFHYSNVELDDGDDDTEEQELKVGNAMEFLVVTEEAANGRKEKISARNIKFLPPGSVQFQTILATGVTGVVTRCPHPQDSGYSSDMVGTVRLTNSIKDTNDEGVECDAHEVTFHSPDSPGGTFSVRDGAIGLWVREGDTLLFDVAKETIDGSLRVFPTKKQVGEDEEEAETASVKLVACGFAGRTEGTVHVMKEQFGFIHCAERPVDSYFRFYEQFPKELHMDLLRGMGIQEMPNTDLAVGVEVQFDLSIQRLTGQSRQRTQRGGPVETLKCTRVLVLPKGTVMFNKIIAKDIKGVVEKEDGKQPYAGTIELEEERKSMTFEERHPLVTKLVQSLLESDDTSSFVFPDVQSVKEDDVVMEAVDTFGKGKLQCSRLPIAGHPKTGGRLCIVRESEEVSKPYVVDTKPADENQDQADTTGADGALDEPAVDKVNSTKKKGRKKKKPKKMIKLIRYDKHSLAKEFQGGVPPSLGDEIICDVIQSRRTGLIQITNLRILVRKNPDAELEGTSTESTETGVGIVSEIVPARQFGFISILDEGATKREVLFFHFRNVQNNGTRSDDSSSKGPKGLGVKKGDEAKFIIATQAGGKRTATKIEILPTGTLDIPSKAAKNACNGFVLMEPSHSSLKDTPDRHNRSRPNSLSPLRGGVSPKRGTEGGRWGKVDLKEGKSRNKITKEEGCILLTSDPSNMFAPQQQQKKVEITPSADSDAIDEKIEANTAAAAADAIPECAICTHMPYKSGAIAMHGAGATSVADSAAKGPRRGDLVSFVKAKSGRTIRDVRVVTKGAATLIRGRLEQIVVDKDSPSMGTAVFIAATEKEETYPIQLKEIVSCEVSVLKDNEAVEGLLHEGKIFGVCRTKDLFLESKLGLSHKERPKLNLTVRKGLGGKIMAQTMMAKGPDGSNGFASGWTTRVSQYATSSEDEH